MHSNTGSHLFDHELHYSDLKVQVSATVVLKITFK